MSFETTKAMKRRYAEHDAGGFPWRDIFKGQMLDVGAGPDPLPFPTCIAFDTQDGDANYLSRYFPANSMQVIHSSQSAEHMVDPAVAILDWLTVLRTGGNLIFTVPSWELYEGMVWPSRFNSDHKSTWSIWQKGSPAPIHCKLPEWLDQFGCEIRLCRLVDDNYDYKIGTSKDQTWRVEDGVECWLEAVLRKPSK